MAEVAAEQDGDLAVGEPVPLQERWCFWVDKPVSGNATAEQYEESLHNLCTVQTVQVRRRLFPPRRLFSPRPRPPEGRSGQGPEQR